MQAVHDAFRRAAGTHLNPASGVLAVVGMLLPLLALETLGYIHVSSNAAAGTLLGVLFVAFCDLGPSVRIRVRAMAAGAVVGALLMGLGTAIGGPWWVAVPAIGLATFLSGLLPMYGKVVAQVSVILTIVFALALGKGSGPSAALSSALGFLFGGLFFLALVLTVFGVWRVFHPSTPESAAALDQPRAALPPPRVPLPSRSLLLQLALIRALGAAVITGVAWGAGVPYPHWAPSVVIASVRTDQVAAASLTTQRIVGTVLGAGLADVVLAWVHSPLVLAGLALAGLFLAFTVKDVNNTFFIFFLTLLTLFLINIPSQGPTYAVLRIVTTLIGAVAALAVSWLSAWLMRRASAATPHAPPPGEAVA